MDAPDLPPASAPAPWTRLRAAAERAGPWCAVLMAFGIPWSRVFYRLGLLGLLACLVVAWPWPRLVDAVRREPVCRLALALFAWIALGLLYTPASWPLALHDVSRYLKLLVLLPLVLLAADLRTWRRILLAYALGTAVLVLPTLLDVTGLLQWLPVDLARLRDASYDLDAGRVYFRNHIVQGVHLNLVLVLLALAWIHRPARRRWLLAALALGVADVLFFLHARGALLALAGVGSGIALASLRSWRARGAAAATLVALAAGLYLASPALQELLEITVDQAIDFVRLGDSTSSIGSRLQFWDISLGLWNATPAAPLVGSGPGTFRDTLLHADVPEVLRQFWHAHNEFLMLAGQHGALGLGLFLSLLLAAHAAVRHAPPLHRGIVRWGLLVFALSCLSDASLHNEWEGWAFMLWLGLAVAVHRAFPQPFATAQPRQGLAVASAS